MLLSVIIPVYNEVRTLAAVLEAVRAVPVEKEIIVVDGQSTDGTRALLEKEAARGDVNVIAQARRNGRGGAILEGLKVARGDVIVFQDGDLELDPAAFAELIAPIREGRADIVFGSRFLGIRPPMTFLQYWGNRAVTGLFNVLWRSRVTDVECCYQMFRAALIEGARFRRRDMAFTLELSVWLIESGRPWTEVPVRYVPRTRAEGKKLYWGDGFRALGYLVQRRFFGR